MRAVCLALSLVLMGCPAKRDADPLVSRAAFGVFFGGQIQDRSELPFELDLAKQRVGIRIDFRAPLSRSVAVNWEIERPLNGKTSDAAQDRVVEVGEAAARVGESRLDVPVLLRRGQVLGTWHVRLKIEGRTALERDVLVFDPRERRERQADAGH